MSASLNEQETDGANGIIHIIFCYTLRQNQAYISFTSMRIYAIIIITFLVIRTDAQHYNELCQQLLFDAFEAPVDNAHISKSLQDVLSYIDTSLDPPTESCNCRDSVWHASLMDGRRFRGSTHGNDTSIYLRVMASKMDSAMLQKEFAANTISTTIDSLSYVIDRMSRKDSLRIKLENNWLYTYCNIDSEIIFIKRHQRKLKDQYLQIFDDTTNTHEIRDRMLLAFFGAGNWLEDDILSRLQTPATNPYFYRMIGILRTAGKDATATQLIAILKMDTLSLKEKKVILHILYSMFDRDKMKHKSRKQFETFLRESSLDSLSRYDLFTH